MKTDASGLDLPALVQHLHRQYGLHLSRLTFLPVGEDSYCYRAHGADATYYLVRAQRVGTSPNLERAYRLVSHLRGLPGVTAPLATTNGGVASRHASFTIAVFPFIEGRTLYETGLNADVVPKLARLVASLHGFEGSPDLDVPFESFSNPFEQPIRRALGVAEHLPIEASRYQRKLGALVLEQRTDVLATLARMKQLGNQIRHLRPRQVLTHGDPNLANLIVDQQGEMHLTDWGDIGYGPVERDLSAYTGHWFGDLLEQYLEHSGPSTVHPILFEYYAYRWALQEIADYSNRILFANQDSAEDAHAWVEIQPYLPIPHAEISEEMLRVRRVIDGLPAASRPHP